jgi:hypothetical protein
MFTPDPGRAAASAEPAVPKDDARALFAAASNTFASLPTAEDLTRWANEMFSASPSARLESGVSLPATPGTVAAPLQSLGTEVPLAGMPATGLPLGDRMSARPYLAPSSLPKTRAKAIPLPGETELRALLSPGVALPRAPHPPAPATPGSSFLLPR